MEKWILSIAAILCLAACNLSDQPLQLEAGMTIDRSMTIEQDTFYLPGGDSLDTPVLTISGKDIVVDFNGAVLIGTDDPYRPDQFSGLAIRIENGKNITLKNLHVHGYKVGLLAENVDSLTLLDSDLSYNYRPRLKSIREREDISDWLSYHQNEDDQWLRYGAGIYLKNCPQALVRGIHITGNQNGLLLTGCNDGLFYNNNIRFNSGLGIGLYRSSRNNILHNRLDWNVRGYSYGFYSRGQDSAGILCYEQSNDNVFAYNSATHSGDGFFLWAGQTTMDTGEGGCNGNLLYKNDFSHAPTNGIEVTFSSNKLIHNRLEECKYGIWGGYSYQTLIAGNIITGNHYGLAIEHGQENEIVGNAFIGDTIGIQLWERKNQPAGWRYAQNRDVSSRDYRIEANYFLQTRTALEIGRTHNAYIAGNTFYSTTQILKETAPNKEISQQNNFLVQTLPDSTQWLQIPDSLRVEPLPDAQDAFLPGEHPRGRSFILVNEWGPYNFQYPDIWLRTIEGNRYTFLLLGPKTGNWKAVDGQGWTTINPKTGTFPATIVAEKEPGAQRLELDLEFIGEAFLDQFGQPVSRGAGYAFPFNRFEPQLEWNVSWHNYDSLSDPLKHTKAFMELKEQIPAKQEKTGELAYNFWRAPGDKVQADKFATFAQAEASFEPGTYRIVLTSDDGVRMWVDGELILENWDVHTPESDEVTLELDGKHTFEIAHFDKGGFATLAFRIIPE